MTASRGRPASHWLSRGAGPGSWWLAARVEAHPCGIPVLVLRRLISARQTETSGCRTAGEGIIGAVAACTSRDAA
ncbi:hypothetical protein AAFF_G00254120 [Aldrovandia affinis]|uniref:Uncharacterized protein n=1 Tax=Aldrovandia affinis TaxID=143900 RepID=A0AAD7RCI6_9TELE|nr:hypothetical protein AAFF_G00254120 [Aldrovandia affinis]